MERPVDKADLMLKSDREIPNIPCSRRLESHRRIATLLPADISGTGKALGPKNAGAILLGTERSAL